MKLIFTRERNKLLACILIFLLVIDPWMGLAGRMGIVRSEAAAITITSKGGNLLDGRPFDFFGKSQRIGLWYWQDSGKSPVFCIQPTKSMSSGTGASLDWESMEETVDVSREQYDLLSTILTFYGCTKGQTMPVSHSDYIVAQSAIWAVMSGDWQDTDYFKSEMETIYDHLAYARSRSEKEAIIENCRRSVDLLCNRVNEYYGSESAYIPEFASKYREDAACHAMKKQDDGTYAVTFTLRRPGKSEEIKDFVYQLPAGWECRYGENEVTFVSSEKTEEPVLVTGSARPGTRLAECIPTGIIGFIRPGGGRQEMIGELLQDGKWNCYFKLFTEGSEGGEYWYLEEAKRYRHSETFQADYLISLKKTDSETGQALEGAEFEVLEGFDGGQLGGTLLDRTQIKVWDGLKVFCEPAETDHEGSFLHRDKKEYLYEKTYCAGHPDPVIVYEEPEDDGEEDNDFPTLEEVEEEAWEAWQREVDLCESLCDFHSVDGSGEEQMTEDRDRSYEEFTGLEYQYTIREIRARNGYILHGLHSDDRPVETVSIKSGQSAGAGTRLVTGMKGKRKAEKGVAASPAQALKKEFGPGFYNRGRKKRADSYFLTSAVRPVKPAGNPEKVGHEFAMADHRTEGEFHINKRDMELYAENPDESYGVSQGDSTLEGAVYGLYAKEPIIHPDGATGVVFEEGALVAIATTDENGDADFTCITELSPNSEKAVNLEGSWIGHPLILGRYQVREIARSEGYELSVTGLSRPETNRGADRRASADESKSVRAGGLSHRMNDWDGSWNEFTVSSDRAVDGYDIFVSGYPRGSVCYRVENEYAVESRRIVTGARRELKRDPGGAVVFQRAAGGEYRLDASGNRIQKLDETGAPVCDYEHPQKEQIKKIAVGKGGRTALVASPGEASVWEKKADPETASREAEQILKSCGYRILSGKHAGGAPWAMVRLEGDTVGDWAASMLDFYEAQPFWDCAMTGEIEEKDDGWYARLFYDYSGYPSYAGGVKDRDGCVYIKKKAAVRAGEETYETSYYVKAEPDDYVSGEPGILTDRKEAPAVLDYSQDLASQIVTLYSPVFSVYQKGEFILDSDGNPVPVYETVYEYGDSQFRSTKEKLTPVEPFDYDEKNGIFHIRIETGPAMEGDGPREETYRICAPQTQIVFDGKTMAYADYLTRIAGASVACSPAAGRENDDSYEIEAALLYPGGRNIFQDGGTRDRPAVVRERVIRQSIRVEKNIALDSYNLVNTYRIHRDPFTVLYGGFSASPAGSLPGFTFKVYLKSQLIRTGKLKEKAKGVYDYEEFLKKEPALARSLALPWDDPGMDGDGDLTTVQASQNDGKMACYGVSAMLPYGTYVVVEQQPAAELANRHYRIAAPMEISIPYIPSVLENGSVDNKHGSREYYYDSALTPEQLVKRYYIRFNEENHQITAHGHGGDYTVYKYGRSEAAEQKGWKDHIYYEVYLNRDGEAEDYGVWKDHVDSMTGMTEALDRVYAPALVPWSVKRPAGIKSAEGDNDFIAFADVAVENTFYSTKLRIEKLDGETGENIIHDGAYFRIYAAARDISGNGESGVEGSGRVLWNPDGTPVYDRKEQIFMKDETGAKVGEFRAFTTVRDISINGTVKEEPVGYIETYQQLGAGVYVLEEVCAPPGYRKSKNIAIEIYSDGVAYYDGGNREKRTAAQRYDYTAAGGTALAAPVEVNRISVKDEPIRLSVRKVEGGGKNLSYRVGGSLKRLLSRGDVVPAYLEDGSYAGWGLAEKEYDIFSASPVACTEQEAEESGEIRPVYGEDGSFEGYGLDYQIYIKEAGLTLYRGLVVQKEPDGSYRGITVKRGENGEVLSVTAHRTGTHPEIVEMGTAAACLAAARAGLLKISPVIPPEPALSHIWDYAERQNAPVLLLHYDIKSQNVRKDTETGRIYGLDDRGNPVCWVDEETGLAYVEGEHGETITWVLNEREEKEPALSIPSVTQDGKNTIYDSVKFIEDENGLPLYYLSGSPVYRSEEWVTSGEREARKISRIPEGAYILEEVRTPLNQGYIHSKPVGIVVDEVDQDKTWFMEDDFTKVEIAKIDCRTEAEIPGAVMTLYRAGDCGDANDKPLGERGEESVYARWISGYLYDDDGAEKRGIGGERLRTSKPHWLDHVPPGDYLLEETVTPYSLGYVSHPAIPVQILETGEVQSWTMRDDYTRIEIDKYDAKTRKAVPGARIGLYKAELGSDGQPLLREDKTPALGEKLFEWVTGGPASGKIRIASTAQAYYMQEEDGGVQVDYLPVGFYVLEEEEAPEGYAKSQPVIIHVDDIGGEERVQKFAMWDVPLEIIVIKTERRTGRYLPGATLFLYRETQGGEELVDSWMTNGSSHRLSYIKEGKYRLTEEQTPAGYLRSQDLYFEIVNTQPVRIIHMVDQEPKGTLQVLKTSKKNGEPLAGAVFTVLNKTTGDAPFKIVTDQLGRASLDGLSIGGRDQKGEWEPYTYQITEIKAPAGYLLKRGSHEFRFLYEGPDKERIFYEYSLSDAEIPGDSGGGKPNPPKDDKKPTTGFITASYPIHVKGAHTDKKISYFLDRLPRLGDFSHGAAKGLFIALFSAAAGLWLIKKRRGKYYWFLTLLILLIAVKVFPSMAAEGETVTKRDGLVTVTSEFMVDVSRYVPEPTYTDSNGKKYALLHWRWEADRIEARTEEVKNAAIYESVEEKDELIESGEITVKDELTGQVRTEIFPIIQSERRNERWVDDFLVPLTFHLYGSDQYRLGETLLSSQEPLPDVEKHRDEILRIIEADPESYKILSVSWDGEEYLDSQNILCRDAIARGQKKVADYILIYGGAVTFPPVSGYRCTAVYALEEAQTDEPSEVSSPPEARWNRGLPSGPAVKPEKRLVYALSVRKAVIVALSVFCLLAAAGVVWLTRRLRKSRGK